MCLRRIVFEPLFVALQVIKAFGLQSIILWASDSEENPANTTLYYTPNKNRETKLNNLLKV